MIIFIDMDGVLCDFVSAAFKVHGRTYCESSFPRYVYELEGILKVTTETFWEKIHEHGEDFWVNLEPYPWCHELVTWMQKLGDVVIATSPSRCHTSYAGKRRWLVNNGLGHLPSMFGAHKHLMAAPGRVLIDDAEHNLKAWAQRGGIDVRFPQPWNVAGYALPAEGNIRQIWNTVRNATETLT